MASRSSPDDTIVAIATPPGRGGVGVIRISGARAAALGRAVTGLGELVARHAHYAAFRDRRGGILDRGLLLYFPGPASFTGEDVVELHGHASPVLLELLLRELTAGGARHAEPGEFSQRAFLNGKLDLAQAEAIADIVAAGSEQAARSAMRVLEGRLSQRVTSLGEAMVRLRAWVEASIDFPDDDVDFLDDARLRRELAAVVTELAELRARGAEGRVLRDGLTLVIAGPPNAGKSSLMNALAEREVAIVTPQAGTTRDLLREPLAIEGVPLNLVDTAGLRVTDEPVEQAGIARARAEIERADRVLYVVDATFVPPGGSALRSAALSDLPPGVPVTVIRNKIDLTGEQAGIHLGTPPPESLSAAVTTVCDAPEVTVALSARTGEGLDQLRRHLQEVAGLTHDAADTLMARARHLTAMDAALAALGRAQERLAERSGELVAEELREAHEALMTLTGEMTGEDLLGEIFSRFCIGK